ncbi:MULTISPECIES: Yip1 family protein [Bacillota]|uniref:Yip1 family protein n=1 Tax=Bacillota TaxID=1239 RepID=UPI0039EEC082
MIKKALLLILSLSIICFIPSYEAQAHAAENDPLDEMLDVSGSKSKIKKEYKEEPLLNYQLDADESFFGSFDMFNKSLHGLNNIIWYVNIFITKLVIILLEQAYTLDLLGSLIKHVDKLVTGIKRSTWDVFAIPFMVVAAIVALINYMMASRRQKSWEQIIVLFILIGLSMLFFTKPAEMLKTFNEVSKDVSGDVLSSTMPIAYKNVNGIDDAVVVMGNTIWKNHVKYPWYILQFGSIKDGKVDGPKLLKFKPYSDERKDFVSEQVENGNGMMELIYSLGRFILVLFYLIYTLIVLLMVGIFSILILVYQLIPLILLAFTAVVFVISLWPGMGLLVVQRWLARIASAVLSKVFISIFLSIYMILATLMYEAFDGRIILQLIALFVVCLVLILERQRIMGMFQAIPKGANAVANEVERPFDYKERMKGRLLQAAALTYAGTNAYRAFKGVNNAWQKKKLRPDAMNYLQNKYDKEKGLAEQKSLETGRPVYYSDFVKQVDERMEQGLPLFTGDQIENATDTLRDIKKQKGDFNRLYLPTGLNTTNPDTYTDAARSYQNRLKQKQQDFDSKREAHKLKADQTMHNLRAPFHLKEDPGIPMSDAVKERQNQAKEMASLQQPISNMAMDEVAATNENNNQINGFKVNVPTDQTKPQFDNSYKTPEGDIVGQRQEYAKSLKGRKPKALFNIPPNVSKLTEEQASQHVSNQWDKAQSNMSKQEFVAGLKQQQRDSYDQFSHLNNYQKYEEQGNLEKYKALWPKQAEEIEGIKASTGKSTVELRDSAQQNYQNNKVILSAAKKDLGINTETLVAVKSPSLSNIKREVEIVANANPVDKNTIADRQAIARSIRRNPPKSDFMIQNNIPDLSNQEVQQQVKVEWKEQGGSTKPSQYVDVLVSKANQAKGELRQLEVYQQYEAKGDLDSFKVHFKPQAEQIEKLKNSLKVDTPELINMAKKNVQNLELKANTASEYLNLQTKDVIKVKGQGNQVKEVKVKTPGEYEHKILYGDMPKQVDVKVDDAYKQSIVNDWNKQRNLFGVSREDYVQTLAATKKEHYGRLQTFKNAKSATTDPNELAQFEEMFQRHRAVYLDAKERHKIAADMLGIEPKKFSKKKKD